MWIGWRGKILLSIRVMRLNLRFERENSLEETHKRLSYVLPMIETLRMLSRAEEKRLKLKTGPHEYRSPKWLEWAREIFSLSQSGITYSENQYDIDRYKRLQEITAEMIASQSEIEKESVLESFSMQAGYITPKVDVRGAVIRDNKILLIQERADGKWGDARRLGRPGQFPGIRRGARSIRGEWL
jgi:hypothetical protein